MSVNGVVVVVIEEEDIFITTNRCCWKSSCDIGGNDSVECIEYFVKIEKVGSNIVATITKRARRLKVFINSINIGGRPNTLTDAVKVAHCCLRRVREVFTYKVGGQVWPSSKQILVDCCSPRSFWSADSTIMKILD